MRLIDADVLLEKIREIIKLALDRAVETPANMPFPIYQNPAYTRYSTQADEREKFKVMIDDAPTVQPERKTGRWIKVNSKTAINCSACYQCSWSLIFEDTVKRFNFCPNCGADMRGNKHETD